MEATTLAPAEIARLRAERYAGVKAEHRTGRPLEIRQNEAGDWEFDGLASTWDRYDVEDCYGSYTEQFKSGAFDKTLAERDDTVLLVNHAGLPLARTTSGTLKLSVEEDHGLRALATLLATDPDVQQIVPKMQRGDLWQMSISFLAMRQEWNDDYTERTILEARLFDVSIVTWPMNPGTSATVRTEDLLTRLAEMRTEDLALELRSAGSDGLRSLMARVHERLGELVLPAGGGRALRVDQEPAAAPEPSQRDAAPTMSVHEARRHIDLMKVGRR
jgi:HK97 family phage prohead protease